MNQIGNKNGLVWIWVSVVIVTLDYITKFFAKKQLLLHIPLSLSPFLNLTLSYNKGIAFGILNSDAGWQTWLFGSFAIFLVVGILLYLYRISYKERTISIALSMVIGGALGNFYDRVHWGQVTDFIQCHVSDWYFATFNIADAAICIGMFLLVIKSIAFPSQQQKSIMEN